MPTHTHPTAIPTIRALLCDFATGARQPSTLLAECLATIAARNPAINAIPTQVDSRSLFAEAVTLDAAIRDGRPVGMLAGMPWAAKDTHRTRGLRTTRGSPIFADDLPDSDDPVVARLRAAGALLVGKSNTPEFAAGSQTFNPVLGTTLNPRDPTRTVGGSSGGAAAALATGMVLVAEGSDLAASLRNPASFCGVTGLRPSAVSEPSLRMHANAFSTLSMVGPMARHVDDLRLINRAIFAPRAPRPIGDWARALHDESAESGRGAAPGMPRAPRSLRIAWSVDCAGAMPVSAPVRASILDAVARLRDAGATLVEAAPDFSGADTCFQTLRGLYFVEMLGELYETERARMKDTVVWNIEFGLSLNSRQIADANRVRSAIFGRVADFISAYDAWLLPSAQVLPFPVEVAWPTEIDGHRCETYIDWLRSCYWISVSGHPAISIPCGLASDGGPPLPVGLQLMGRWREDESLLDVAETVETLLR